MSDNGFFERMLIRAHPFWIEELSGLSDIELQKICNSKPNIFGPKGDNLLFGSKKSGETAELFNHLAEGIAALTLLVKHPVPWGNVLFYPNGAVSVEESDEAASLKVWNKNGN